VVVAVVTVLVVELAVHEVVGMVPVRHGRVPTAWPVAVVGAVRTVEGGRAPFRVCAVDGEAVLVHVSRVRMVQMSILEVVDVAVVHHRRVAAARTMVVRGAVTDVMRHVRLPVRVVGELDGAARTVQVRQSAGVVRRVARGSWRADRVGRRATVYSLP
jgi:hypothetical protein